MPASRKIINKLRERRSIEANLRRMRRASSVQEYRRQAQEIASQGTPVITTIVANLDSAPADLVMAMGMVATYLHRESVIRALRRAVHEPDRTDQGRLAAISILGQFLDEHLDDDLLESLHEPAQVAVSSLEEVLAQAPERPALLVEFVQGLDRQDPDVALGVVGALRDRALSAGSGKAPRVAEVLRMMAQDVREEIACAALDALGALRLTAAAWALQTLLPTTFPALRPRAERQLRKLEFSGIEVEPLPAPEPHWRALVSPVDGTGQQSVWFIQEDRATGQARFLNVLLNDRFGAVEAVGHAQVSSLAVPPRRPLGDVHDVALPDGSGALLLLEATFDLGRRLVADAVARNRQTRIPVAGRLRLLNPWLWGFGDVDRLPPRALPDLSGGDTRLEGIDRLLRHPALATWTTRSEATLRAAEEAGRHPGWDLELWVKQLAAQLFTGPEVAQMMERRLTATSEWLLLSGDEPAARLALAAGSMMREERPQDHAFLQALIRRDLELVLRRN